MMKAGPARWPPDELEAVAGIGEADVAQDDVRRLVLDRARSPSRDVAGRPDDRHVRTTPGSARPGRRRSPGDPRRSRRGSCRRSQVRAPSFARPARRARGRRTVMHRALASDARWPRSRRRGRSRSRGDVQAEAEARPPDAACRAGCRPRTSSEIVARPMPGPVVADRDLGWPPRPLDRRHRSVSEPGACSMALARRLRNTCSSRPGSARTQTARGGAFTRIGRGLGQDLGDLDGRPDDS